MCSTWMRVFISMKNKMPLLVDQNSIGPTFTYRLTPPFHPSLAHLPSKPVSSAATTFLDHFLVAPLNGAIPFAEMDDVAVAVGHDLKFHVVRIHDELLHVNLDVTKCFLRLLSRAVESRLRLGSLCAARMPRPPPPATALIITG